MWLEAKFKIKVLRIMWAKNERNPSRSNWCRNNARKKISLLAEFMLSEDSEHEYFAEFVEWADLGLPLAVLLERGIVDRSNAGDEMIQETWRQFLSVLGHDTDQGFTFLIDAIVDTEYDLERHAGDNQ
jgi:hypothetical protein